MPFKGSAPSEENTHKPFLPSRNNQGTYSNKPSDSGEDILDQGLTIFPVNSQRVNMLSFL